MPARSPYEDTSVSVGKSQDEIRSALREAEAEGVQFEEDWSKGTIVVRFRWKGMICRFEATPLPEEIGPRGGKQRSVEQRERQAWRGMAWYITSMVKAATFGLFEFEDIFMSYFEGQDGKTVGEVFKPQLKAGRLLLDAPKGHR